MAAAAPINVHVDLKSLGQVQLALIQYRDSVLNVAMKTGATKGARRTLPTAKSTLKKHRRSQQLEKSLGVKYKAYRKGWVVLLGPRKYFRGSLPGLMSPNSTTIDPIKYAHILRGGRKEVHHNPAKSDAMPIFVRKLDRKKRKPWGIYAMQGGTGGHGTLPHRKAAKLSKSRMTTYGKPLGRGKGMSADRFRKVPGGWLLFSPYARRAPAYPWLDKAAPAYGSNIKASVIQEVQSELPRIAARVAARGGRPYRI